MALSAQIKRVNSWHEQLAEWLILNGDGPGWNAAAAKHFGRQAAWISTVVHSDAFQDYYQRLRADTVVPQIFSARERMLGTLDQALTMVQDKLEKDGETIPLSGLLNAVDLLAKRTGHGEANKSSPDTIVQNQVLIVSKDDLAESRARMRGGKVTASLPLALDASVESASSPDGTGGS